MKKTNLSTNQLKLNKNKISSLSLNQIQGGRPTTAVACETLDTGALCSGCNLVGNDKGHGKTGVNGQCNAGGNKGGGTNVAHTAYCDSIEWC